MCLFACLCLQLFGVVDCHATPQTADQVLVQVVDQCQKTFSYIYATHPIDGNDGAALGANPAGSKGIQCQG